jgi:hypothetical protein
MPYFKNNNINLLFIHIPKTGGSSIEEYFKKKFNIKLDENSLFTAVGKRFNDVSYQHQTYIDLYNNKNIFKINYNNLKIMTVVRNPYSRIVSDLFFLKLINLDSNQNQVFIAIRDKYLKNKYDNHPLPQYKFVVDEKDNLINNIIIIKNENLDQSMKNLGYNDFNIHTNVNKLIKDKKYIDYLNNNSIKLINRIYHKDFVLFKYKKIIVNKNIVV